MSHFSTRPLTSDEYDLVAALANLSISGTNQGIAKTGATSLSNITFGSGSLAWGGISGTLSNQTDLQTALNAKQSTTLTSAHILVGNSSSVATDVALSGDATISNAGVLTLASVISAGGPIGSATVTPIITYDAKGRLTAVSSATITPAASSITGGAALTKTDDTNVTLTLGGSPSTALLVASSLTLGWTGTLADSRLSTTAVSANSYGSATQVATFTVSATGRLTAAGNTTVTPAVGSITGLGTGVATALAINVGTAGAFVVNGGALGTPSSGTGTNITGIPAASILAGTFGAGSFSIGALTHTGNLTTSAVNIVTDTTTGTKFGTATNQKISFYNSTPIVQPTGDVITGLQNLGLMASATITATTNANLTGPITSVGNATSIASQTGTGTKFVVDTSPTIITPTITTSATVPLIIGGTGTTSTLTLKTTTGVGTTNADMIFQVGNNGATEAMRILNSGNITYGTKGIYYSSIGKLVLGATAETQVSTNAGLELIGTATQDIFAGMGLDVANGPAFNFGYTGASFGRGSGFFNVRPDVSAVAPNPSLRFFTANTQVMVLTNVGNMKFGTSLALRGTTEGTNHIDIFDGTAPAGTLANGISIYTSAGQPRSQNKSGTDLSIDGTLFTQTADKSVTNTLTETSIVGTGVGSLTLPANFWVAGKTIRVIMSGVYSTVAVTGDTVTIKVKYGSTVIASQATTGLVAGASNLFWWAEALVTCRSTGATGTVQISGSVRYQIASAAVIENELNNSVGTTTIDTTASALFDVSVTHSAANASNSVKSLVSSFEVLN